MKITNEIIAELKKSQPESKGLKTSHFRDMLDYHMKQVRGEDVAQTSLHQKWKAANEALDREFEDWMKHLDSLKGADAGYFDKAHNKKTLAENFNRRFGSKVEARIAKFRPLIEAKANKYDLDPNLLAALVKQESNFNPYAVSHCGAMGLGQLMPGTARHLGVKDPFNAAQNLEGAAKYLREMLDTFGGNTTKALAAYNAGPGAVQKYGGVPPYRETQNYVRSIKSHFNVMIANGYFEGAKGKTQGVG